MPRVGHPWRKHFCDAWFIVMEVDTSVMIILVMSWNTSTTAQVWLSWFCHKFVMDVHAWQKTRPTMTNMYHHGSVFFCSVYILWWTNEQLIYIYILWIPFSICFCILIWIYQARSTCSSLLYVEVVICILDHGVIGLSRAGVRKFNQTLLKSIIDCCLK